MNNKYHAWFSEDAKKQNGSVFYKNSSNEIIEVTVISKNIDNGSFWEDAMYLGYDSLEFISSTIRQFDELEYSTNHITYSFGSY